MGLRNPSVAEVTAFLQSFFPVRAGDLPFIYHRPFAPSFSAANFTVSNIVLSVTATPGVYTCLENGTKLGFLHRPFDLNRRQVPRFGTILTSHKGFDEVLTVGYNVALANRLGLDSQNAAVIQGYKGDPDRRIGLVARFAAGCINANLVKDMIYNEFQGNVEASFGFEQLIERNIVEPEEWLDGMAIMNAFHPEEVERVLGAASTLGLTRSGGRPLSLLYLTGAVREPGLQAALERGMKVICVGHRSCEDWGIHFLADQLRFEFPKLKVHEVYEEELPRVQVEKQSKVFDRSTSECYEPAGV